MRSVLQNGFVFSTLSASIFVPSLCVGQKPLPSLTEEVIFIDTPQNVAESIAGARLAEASRFLKVGAARTKHDVNGKGIAIAIIDTGIMKDHPDLTGRILEGRNFSGDDRAEDDTNDVRGHGTHVAGIVAASGNHTGMAPGAAVVPLRIFKDKTNSGTSQKSILDALKWTDENAARLGITVANLSLGAGNYSAYPQDVAEFDAVLNRLNEKRVAVVCATGNFYGLYREQGMAFPAICRHIISVGAVYDANVGRKEYNNAIAYTTKARQFAPFSQRLHSSFGDHPGTTIFAPGAVITSSGLMPPKYAADLEGTSMSAPIVSGVIVLMQQAYKKKHQELPSIDQIIAALSRSPLIETDGNDEDDNVPNTQANFPILMASRALDEIAKD
jgi:subtilisin family serine protease